MDFWAFDVCAVGPREAEGAVGGEIGDLSSTSTTITLFPSDVASGLALRHLDGAYWYHKQGEPPPPLQEDTIMDSTTESVTTHDLREGDIVRHYGMRILIDSRGQDAGHPDYPERGATVWFHGTVLNPSQVNADLVPVGWRSSDSCTRCERGQHWQIQGNRRATWAREV